MKTARKSARAAVLEAIVSATGRVQGYRADQVPLPKGWVVPPNCAPRAGVWTLPGVTLLALHNLPAGQFGYSARAIAETIAENNLFPLNSQDQGALQAVGTILSELAKQGRAVRLSHGSYVIADSRKTSNRKSNKRK